MQKYSKCNAHIGHCTFFVVSLGSYQEKISPTSKKQDLVRIVLCRESDYKIDCITYIYT